MSQTLEVPQGRTAIFEVAVTKNSAPANLAGCSVWFTVKKLRSDADADAVIEKTVANGGIVWTDATTGAFRVVLSITDAALLMTRRRWFWDITILFPSGEVHTPDELSGDIINTPLVRRSAA